MRILRAADHRRMAWKNGKGVTTEIAVYPQDSGLEDFAWRVSMADVVEDGAFSLFPGVDRTLSVLAGEGIDLVVADQAPVRLTGQSEPFSFPADAETSATLIAGPITDLNVMTRRDAFSHAVEKHVVHGAQNLSFEADTVLVLCHHGSVEVTAEAETVALSQLDALLLHGPEDVQLSAVHPATIFTIRLDPRP